MPAGPDNRTGTNGQDFRVPTLAPVAPDGGTATGTITRPDRPPHLGYAGIIHNGDGTANVTFVNGARHGLERVPFGPSELLPLLHQKLPTDNILSRIVAAGIAQAEGQLSELTTAYWQNGIVPHHVNGEQTPDSLAEYMASRFQPDGRPTSRQDGHRFVHPDLLIPLDRYEESDPKDTAMARYFAGRLKEKGVKVVEFSASEFGGGVAKNRHRTTSIYEQLGLDIKWGVQSDDDPTVYDHTKEDIHNVLQLKEEPGRGLTKRILNKLSKWGKKDFALWEQEIMDSDVVLIHDPQPVAAGIINEIRAEEQRRRDAGTEDKRRIIIYRCHTQPQPDGKACDTPGTAQQQTWDLLWTDGGISEAQYVIAHPIKSSVPANIPREKVGLMGATEDRFDGLNMNLPPDILRASRHIIDDVLSYQKVEYTGPDGTKREVELRQRPIDWDRGYTLVFNRFDEAKEDVAALRHQLQYIKNARANGTDPKDIVPMVITGNTAMDDPSSRKELLKVYDELMRPEYDDIRDEYVRLMITPSNDFLANTLMTHAQAYMLNSSAEGYETVVKSALLKGKPVISTEIGGPKVQLEPVTFAEDGTMIIEDRDSFLINPFRHDEAAFFMTMLYDPNDTRVYDTLQEAADRHGKEPRDTTMQNVANYLYLIDRATDGGELPGNLAMIHEVMEAAYDEEMRLQGTLPQHADIFVHQQVPAWN